MRNWWQWFLSTLLVTIGGIIFGASGLALAGAVIGLILNSSKRAFLTSGVIAAIFWLAVAVYKIASGQSPQLLALAGALADLSGAKAWLLVIVATLIAFVSGGLGGWAGGSLRQMTSRQRPQQTA